MAKSEKLMREVAANALTIKAQVDELTKGLDACKEQLRQLANGELLELVVEGKGKVLVTKPRDGSEKIVLEVNETKLNASKDLKAKLLEKGVLKQTIKTVGAAKANNYLAALSANAKRLRVSKEWKCASVLDGSSGVVQASDRHQPQGGDQDTSSTG